MIAPIAAPVAAGQSDAFRLADGVEVIRRKGAFLLFSSADAATVKTSPAAAPLLPLLIDGADFQQLHRSLHAAHPDASDTVPKLERFLATLVGSGVVVRGDAEARQRRRGDRHAYPLLDLNRPAAAVARFFAPASLAGLAGLAGVIALLALAMIVMLAASGGLPSLRALVEGISLIGVAIFVALVAPLHEFAHAVACRLAGERVGSAGIVFHGGLIPGPYVDTGRVCRIASRRRRFAVPAAGVLVNLAGAGLVAALLMSGGLPAGVVPPALTVLLLCLLFVGFDTNPFAPSDGSHCAEALLDDELARRHAVQAIFPDGGDARVVRWYRAYMVVHLGLSAILLVWWWN